MSSKKEKEDDLIVHCIAYLISIPLFLSIDQIIELAESIS